MNKWLLIFQSVNFRMFCWTAKANEYIKYLLQTELHRILCKRKKKIPSISPSVLKDSRNTDFTTQILVLFCSCNFHWEKKPYFFKLEVIWVQLASKWKYKTKKQYSRHSLQISVCKTLVPWILEINMILQGNFKNLQKWNQS